MYYILLYQYTARTLIAIVLRDYDAAFDFHLCYDEAVDIQIWAPLTSLWYSGDR